MKKGEEFVTRAILKEELKDVQMTLADLMEFMRDNLVTKTDLKEEIAKALKPYATREELHKDFPTKEVMYDYFEPWAKRVSDLEEQHAMHMRLLYRLDEKMDRTEARLARIEA